MFSKKLTSKHIRLTLLSALWGMAFAIPSAFADLYNQSTVDLLEPFGSSSSVSVVCATTSCIFGAWIGYYASAASWLFDVAVGICIIWMVVSGLRIIVSGDNTQLRDNAMSQMKASAFGLMLLIFAGPILRAINNVGFI